MVNGVTVCVLLLDVGRTFVLSMSINGRLDLADSEPHVTMSHSLVTAVQREH